MLLLQAKYDEFSYFRDYQLNVTDDLLDAYVNGMAKGTSENASNALYTHIIINIAAL